MDRRRQVQHGGLEDLQLNVEDAENREEEPVWLTPYLRDPQPEGERERERANY